MKKSESIRKEIEALEAAFDEATKREVYENPERTEANHNELWKKFWSSKGVQNHEKLRALEDELRRALNQEIAVGDGVTMCLWSDREACTVIARTAKTLTIQRDRAIRDPSFKPEWVPGGFSAVCTNAGDQRWAYERDPNGEIIRCRWSEKRGRWQTGADGSIGIIRGRHERYDYNF